MKSEDLSAIRQGAELANMLPVIEAETARQEKALENRVLMELSKGTLTPEAALQAWMEKAAIRRLLSSFQSKVRIGQTIGEANAKLLETNVGNT